VVKNHQGSNEQEFPQHLGKGIASPKQTGKKGKEFSNHTFIDENLGRRQKREKPATSEKPR